MASRSRIGSQRAKTTPDASTRKSQTPNPNAHVPRTRIEAESETDDRRRRQFRPAFRRPGTPGDVERGIWDLGLLRSSGSTHEKYGHITSDPSEEGHADQDGERPVPHS